MERMCRNVHRSLRPGGEFFLLDPTVSFVALRPRREVYETCLRAAGFGEVTWVPLEVSGAGVREFGADFWADFRANPPLETLRRRA